MSLSKPRDCANGLICKICQNSELRKGIFGYKYLCKIGRKPVCDSCFYFSCIGQENCPCSMCSHYKREI